MTRTTFSRIAFFATVLAFVVVVLGAYTRLSDAGLGCPDWPGCYGLIGAPETPEAVVLAEARFPERPVEAPKAWKEMVHRYFAGSLGLVIAAMAFVAWRNRKRAGIKVVLPVLLVVLVIFQALLGMWTVTQLLQPVIVMGHLLGGLTMLSLLWWLTLRSGGWWTGGAAASEAASGLYPLAVLALLVLVGQLSLGGWTSANYAALACGDFPTCQGSWWPETDFKAGFSLPAEIGTDFEGGLHGAKARTAIHMTHRLGAMVTIAIIAWLGFRAWVSGAGPIRGAALVMLIFVVLQFSLGVANVLMSLPLPVASAHNGVAALLLLSVVSMLHLLRPPLGDG